MYGYVRSILKLSSVSCNLKAGYDQHTELQDGMIMLDTYSMVRLDPFGDFGIEFSCWGSSTAGMISMRAFQVKLQDGMIVCMFIHDLSASSLSCCQDMIICFLLDHSLLIFQTDGRNKTINFLF